jgi:hypothetical protein
MEVSEELEEFEHTHPARAAGDEYQVKTAFAKAGRHRLYLEFTPPGSGQHIVAFDMVSWRGACPAG